MQDDVAERGRAGRGEGFAHAPRCEPALALDDVHARRIGAVVVAGPEGEADRARDADAGGAGREADEGRGRRRVAVERLGAEACEERRRRDRVAAEAEEVLEAQALPRLGGQQVGRADAGELVAQGPHRVEAHRLVARRVRDDVGVVAIGVSEVVVEAVEEDAGDEAPRGDGAAGVPRHRHVVVEHGAERPVEQVESLEVGQLVGGELARAFGQLLTDVGVETSTGAECERHRATPFAGRRVARSPACVTSGRIRPQRGRGRIRPPARLDPVRGGLPESYAAAPGGATAAAPLTLVRREDRLRAP